MDVRLVGSLLTLLLASLVGTEARAQSAVTLEVGGNNIFAVGYAVAATADRVIVGAPGSGTAVLQAGQAFVFDGVSGALLRTLDNPAPDADDFFGAAVGVLGNDVLVGAPGGFSPGPTAAVYLFDSASGALLQTFTSPVPGLHGFGVAVAGVAGGRVLVGDPTNDGLGPDAGLAYLFDATTGALLRTFASPAPDPNARFGAAVAARGGDVLIGAPGDDTAVPQGGAVYLFDGATGALLRTFVSPTPATSGAFGVSVASAGGTVLAGAPGEGSNGAAHLFDTVSGMLLRSFGPPPPPVGAAFGTAVAFAGGNVAIGAPFAHAAGVPSDGTAYLFDASTGALLRTMSNPTPAPVPSDDFGTAIAAVGGNVVVGAPNESGGLGAAYVFCGGSTGCGPCETCGPSGTCVAAPNLTCRTPTPGGSRLRIVNKSTDTSDAVVFRWGAARPRVDFGDFGIPTTVHGYQLCVYDGTGLVFGATAPADGTCAGKACWKTFVTDDYLYRDPDRTPDGLKSIRLHARTEIKAQTISARGLGANLSGRPLGLPATPTSLAAPVRAQMQARDGRCWEGVFSAPRTNTGTRFVGRSD